MFDQLESMNIAQLKELQGRVERQIVKTENKTYQDAADQVYAIAHGLGISLRELLAKTGRLDDVTSNQPPKAKKGQPAPVRYIDPNDDKNKWSGRGRMPKWVKDLIAQGKTLDNLRIPGV